MTAMTQALLYPYGIGGGGASIGPSGAPGAGVQGISAPASGFGFSPGTVGSAIGGALGRGAAGALTGSMFGPIGLAAGVLGNLIGYGVGSNMGGAFGTPGFAGQTDPADASLGVSLGGFGTPDFGGQSDPADASIGAPPGGDDGGDGGGDDGGDGGFFRGGLVSPGSLVGPNPQGPDDGYGALDRGEFVLSAGAVSKLGKKNVVKINAGKFDRKKMIAALAK